MKILFATGIYPPEIGGPAGYVKGVATELANQGHEVAVVTYGDDPELNNKYQIANIKRGDSVLVRYAKYAYQTWKLARKSDLIYAQGPVSEGLPAALASIFARKPLVLKVVGDYAWEQYQQTNPSKSPLVMGDLLNSPHDKGGAGGFELLDSFVTHRHKGKIWLMEAIERWVASQAKIVIVPSKYLKTIVEKWGIDSEKIKVVYNSISPLPEIRPNPSKSPLVMGDFPENSPHDKGGAGGLRGKKLILTAVRAVPWKGGDFLCDVLKDLPKDFVLAVAGDGPSLESWKKHAEELGVSDRVAWLGKLSRKDLTKFYKAADVFVLPTGYEGFPHVVVEAASMGLPCIVSDKGGNPEIAELFPGQVTVAEYQNKQTWVEAITVRITNLRELRIGEKSKLPEVLGFDRMISETFEILKSAQSLNLDLRADSRPNSLDYSSNSSQDDPIEAKSLDSQILRFSDSQVSDRSRVLSIGLEKKLFEDGKVRDRIVEQLKDFNTTIIVFAKQKFDEQVSPNVRVISTGSWNKFFYVTDALIKIWKLRKQKFDVITAQDPTETGLVAYLASKFLKSALAIQDHGYHFHGDYYRKESWLNQLRYLFARFVIARADAIRVVSQRTEEALINLGITKDKIIRFPLTLNSKYQIANSKSYSVNSEQWSVNSEQFSLVESEIRNSKYEIRSVGYFLLVCRFVPIKRIDLAIHAFSIIAKQDPQVKLKIVGSGPLQDQIKQWIADFDLQDRVEIIPWTDNLADLYRGAIATLITSDREGYGMTALESLACSTPVIMTDVGCASEVVKNGENGIIVPVGDVVALANAMESYSTNYESARITNGFALGVVEKDMKDFLLSAIRYQLSAKKKEDEDFWRFSESKKVIEMQKEQKPRLMLYTPSFDHTDPVFGFSVRWVDEFSRQSEKLTIISRFVDQNDVPKNCTGIALGKPWITRVLRLWHASIKYRKDYDKVFLHMAPETAIAGWPVWFILRKPIYLWYAHGATPPALKIANHLVKLIFASSETGLRLKTPKARFIGQGIDTDLFKPNSEIKKENIIITVSRVTPAKKYEDSLEFLAKYKERYPNDVWKYDVIGPSLGHEEYIESLKQKAVNLGLGDRFNILPAVEYTELPAINQRAKLFLSTSETGSIDKVVLEALACGVPVIARGIGYQKLTGVIPFNDFERVSIKLHNILESNITDLNAREAVINEHGLKRLVHTIIFQIQFNERYLGEYL